MGYYDILQDFRVILKSPLQNYSQTLKKCFPWSTVMLSADINLQSHTGVWTVSKELNASCSLTIYSVCHLYRCVCMTAESQCLINDVITYHFNPFSTGNIPVCDLMLVYVDSIIVHVVSSTHFSLLVILKQTITNKWIMGKLIFFFGYDNIPSLNG